MTETDAPAVRDVYHVAAGHRGPGSVRFRHQICCAKLATLGIQTVRESLRTNVSEQTRLGDSYCHVSETLCLLPLSDPPMALLWSPSLDSAFRRRFPRLPACARSCVRVVSNSPVCLLCLSLKQCSPNYPAAPVSGAFYLFSFMCKRAARTAKRLHVHACACMFASSYTCNAVRTGYPHWLPYQSEDIFFSLLKDLKVPLRIQTFNHLPGFRVKA